MTGGWSSSKKVSLPGRCLTRTDSALTFFHEKQGFQNDNSTIAP